MILLLEVHLHGGAGVAKGVVVSGGDAVYLAQRRQASATRLVLQGVSLDDVVEGKFCDCRSVATQGSVRMARKRRGQHIHVVARIRAYEDGPRAVQIKQRVDRSRRTRLALVDVTWDRTSFKSGSRDAMNLFCLRVGRHGCLDEKVRGLSLLKDTISKDRKAVGEGFVPRGVKTGGFSIESHDQGGC